MKPPADPSPPLRPRVPPGGASKFVRSERECPSPVRPGVPPLGGPWPVLLAWGAPWLGAVALCPWVLVCGADVAEPGETPCCRAWRGAGRGSCVGCRLLHTHVHTHTHTHTHSTRLPQMLPDPQPQLKPPTTLEEESQSLGLAQGNRRAEEWLCPQGPGRGEAGTPPASPPGETPGWRSRSSGSLALAGASQAARAPGRVASPGL